MYFFLLTFLFCSIQTSLFPASNCETVKNCKREAWQCPVCNKIYFCHRLRHIRIHTDYKPYVCTLKNPNGLMCNQSFGRKDTLKRHKNSERWHLKTKTEDQSKESLKMLLIASTIIDQ